MANEHGGDTYGRKTMLDFSSNLNPLGMPESVKNAAINAVSESAGYPDPYCRELAKKLSEHENISPEKIVCGNGADDLIYRIVHALKPKHALITKPTFSEYKKALSEVGCEVSEYVPEQIKNALTDNIDMLILCHPNNPTGHLYDPEELRDICDKCLKNGTVFLCDECFIDLCEYPVKYSVKQFINENVIILNAFTKTYAMAGLRLGYALFGSESLARKVRNCGQFWSVSTIAQTAGTAALNEKKYVESARKIIAEERKYLIDALIRYGFTVYPSGANFLLFLCRYPLDEMLLDEGIIIRNCSNFNGLGEGFFRIAVRLHEENKRLVEAIEKIVKSKKA